MDKIEHKNEEEKNIRKALTNKLKNTPIPNDELLENLGLFLNSQNLSRILFFYEIYKKIQNTHGVIFEFGTRWGNISSTLVSLRSIFEPFNRTRKIVCFDTFSGFKGINEKDNYKYTDKFSVSRNYEEYLYSILELQEAFNPIKHIKKFEIVKGDVESTLPKYLTDNPETLVSLAVFDMDLYRPTKAALLHIKNFLHAGSILVFDNLCDEVFPGETNAFREVFSLEQVSLKRIPITARLSYIQLK